MNAEQSTGKGSTAPRLTQHRCRRCRLLIEGGEQEIYYLHSGLCFWCAHVDAQA